MILPVLSDSCYDLNWPIYSCFLISCCTFSTFTCKEWDFQLFQIYVIKILLQDYSIRNTRFILRSNMAFLQLFSEWRMYVFHYFTCNEWDFQPFKHMSLRYFFSEDSNGGTRFMLQFKIAAICTSYLCSKYQNVYSFTWSKNFNFFQY